VKRRWFGTQGGGAVAAVLLLENDERGSGLNGGPF
jgi:hypothetical protein